MDPESRSPMQPNSTDNTLRAEGVDIPSPPGDAGGSLEPPSLGQRLRQPRTLVSFGIAAFVIFLLFRGLDISFSDVWERIKQADKTLLLLALSTYYVAVLIRSVRWRMMLEKVVVKRASGETIPSIGSTWQMVVLSLFVNCIVPARLGDAYRSFLLKDRNRISFGVSFGTILAERLIDLVVMVVVVLVAGVMVFGTHAPGRAEQAFLLGLGVVILGVIGASLLYLFRHRIESLLPSRFTGHYQRLNDGIFSILSRPLPYMGTGVIVWLLDGLRVWLVVRALGAEISLSEAIVVSLLSALVTIIPFTPAGVGFVEGFMIWILPQFGIARSTAVAVALIDRSITFVSLIVVGIVLYLLNLRRGADRDFREAERQELQHEAG
jgi:uncharacterized protein (TIRG00374 family)